MASWSSDYIFNHPWEDVIRAAYRKYPNPFNPAVLGVDVVDRKISENGTLQSHRLLSTEFPLPEIAAKILGCKSKVSHVSEHSELDTMKSRYSLKSRNLTLCNLVTVDETLEYFPHPQDKSKTCLKQQTQVKVNVPWISGYLERLLIDNIDKTANKGRKGLEWVINGIKQEDFDKKSNTSSDLSSCLRNMENNIEKRIKQEAGELKQNMDNFLNSASHSAPL